MVVEGRCVHLTREGKEIPPLERVRGAVGDFRALEGREQRPTLPKKYSHRVLRTLPSSVQSGEKQMDGRAARHVCDMPSVNIDIEAFVGWYSMHGA